jgi:hypothetical protein
MCVCVYLMWAHGHGYNFFIPTRKKTRQVENQAHTRIGGYKLTPKPTPYQFFTHVHVSKMCSLPSLEKIPIQQRT